MGSLDAVVRLLTFIRNKFDLDYMFKKLIAEAYLTPDDVFFEETEEVIQVPDEDISHLKEEQPVIVLTPATPVKTTVNNTAPTVRKTSQPQSPVTVVKPAETMTNSPQTKTPVKETPTTVTQNTQTTQPAPTTPTTKPIDIPSPRESPVSLDPSSPKGDSPLNRSRGNQSLSCIQVIRLIIDFLQTNHRRAETRRAKKNRRRARTRTRKAKKRNRAPKTRSHRWPRQARVQRVCPRSSCPTTRGHRANTTHRAETSRSMSW